MSNPPPAPAGFSGPPPPEYGTSGENKEDRAPPGGYLGENNNSGWSGGAGNNNNNNNNNSNWNSGGGGGVNPNWNSGGGGGNNNNNWNNGGGGGNNNNNNWNNGGGGGNNNNNWNTGGGGGNNNNNNNNWNNGGGGGNNNNWNTGGGGGNNNWNQGGGNNNWNNFPPDPTEPDYSADVWEYIHYAASRVDKPYYPNELSNRIKQGKIEAHSSTTQYTPLHVAVKFGQPEGVRLLLQAGADPCSVDILGETPLTLACCYNVGTDIVRQLLNATPKSHVDHVDKYSWTPLFWAAYHGFYDVAQVMLQYGANKYYQDKRGNRPINHPRVASNNQMRNLLT